MGFFGQPLAAANGAGIGPSGGNTGLRPTANWRDKLRPRVVGPTSSADSGAGTTGQSGSAGGTDANGNPPPERELPEALRADGHSTGSAFGSSNNPTGTGQTFGGGGIIGFSPQSPKQSMLVYKKKNHYNEWEFLYSPQMDQQQMAGGNTGAIGQPASGTTTPSAARHPIKPARRQLQRPSRHPSNRAPLQPQTQESPSPRTGFLRASTDEASYTLNEEPQPQVDFTWGFSNLKPAASSVST